MQSLIDAGIRKTQGSLNVTDDLGVFFQQQHQLTDKKVRLIRFS